MNMGSLAETYLSAYGWKIYGVIYLVFWVSKIMLYPLVRFTFDLVLDYAAKVDGSPSEPLREGFIRMIVMIMVFILGVVPFVPYDVSSAKITMPGCGQKSDDVQKNDYDKRFGGGAYVPLLPYAVMLVSSGVNRAILDALPCVADLIKSNQIANNLAMPNTVQGRDLKDEVTQFNQLCYGPAKEFMEDPVNNDTPLKTEVVRQLKAKYGAKIDSFVVNSGGYGVKKVTVEDIRKGLNYAGSDFFTKVIYSNEACDNFKPTTILNQISSGSNYPVSSPVIFNSSDLQKTWTDMCLGIKNNRIFTAHAKASTPSGLASEYQKSQGIDAVRCGDWWDGKSGLGARIGYAGFASSINQFAASLRSDNSSNFDPVTQTQIDLTQYDKDPEEYIKNKFNKADPDVLESMIFQMNQASVREGESVLSSGQKAVVIGGGLISFFTNRGGMVSDLTGMAMTAAIAKAAMKLAHPILLMLIYALWLVFLVIGEFKGMVLIKGLMMIFVVKFCTSVFAIADRLADELVTLLVPGFGLNFKTFVNAPDVAIIYMVGTLMYLAVPSILMYLVLIAGGPDASRLSSGSSKGGDQVGKTGGKTIGVGAGKGATLAESKIKQSAKEAHQRYFPKGK